MKILITGGSGFIGRHLVNHFISEGHSVTVLTRNINKASTVLPASVLLYYWNPLQKICPTEIVASSDIVIHLAGENIIGWWNKKKRSLIKDSRILSTQILVDCFKDNNQKPKKFISASAVGYYGDRGDEMLSEDSSVGEDFLAITCKEWEEESNRSMAFGVPSVQLRTSIVLSNTGGALKRLVPIYNLGFGAKYGGGNQWWPWIHIDDFVSITKFVIQNELTGTFNVSAPSPIRQNEFAHLLAQILNKHALFSIPKFFLRMVLGELALEMVGSRRVIPEKLLNKGFIFKHPEFIDAVNDLVGK
jgi:hypothetical protein